MEESRQSMAVGKVTAVLNKQKLHFTYIEAHSTETAVKETK